MLAAAAGPTRRYAGTSHIDVANLSAAQATELVDEIGAKGLTSPASAFTRTRSIPTRRTATQVIGHLST